MNIFHVALKLQKGLVNLGRSYAFVDNEIFYNVSIVSSNYETFSETGERGREREGGENVRGKRILIKPAAFPKEILYVFVLIYIYRYQFTIFVLPFKTLYLIVVGLRCCFQTKQYGRAFERLDWTERSRDMGHMRRDDFTIQTDGASKTWRPVICKDFLPFYIIVYRSNTLKSAFLQTSFSQFVCRLVV